jgi:hypothetical protein
MSSPERLNVLLSRARNGLIMIGNGETFRAPRSGTKIWKFFFRLLDNAQSVFNGLPVQCQNHPNQATLLKSVADFKTKVPNGGCLQPWYVTQ